MEISKEKESDFEHDLALSFAGENRDIVESIAIELRENGVDVFYDDFYKAELVGKDLSDYFKKKYSVKSKYVVIFISKYYPLKDWTNFEIEIALDKTKTMKGEFILPVRLDDTIMHGIKRTIGYIDFRQEGVDGTVKILLNKLKLPYRKIMSENLGENKIVQQLLDELVDLFIRLYKSKAGDSSRFAKIILNSLEMQKYFGITIREPLPGKDLDDLPIFFLYKLFKLIPNSATLGWDPDHINKHERLLNKNSPINTIESRLVKFFNTHLLNFVKREFNIELKITKDIGQELSR